MSEKCPHCNLRIDGRVYLGWPTKWPDYNPSGPHPLVGAIKDLAASIVHAHENMQVARLLLQSEFDSGDPFFHGFFHFTFRTAISLETAMFIDFAKAFDRHPDSFSIRRLLNIVKDKGLIGVDLLQRLDSELVKLTPIAKKLLRVRSEYYAHHDLNIKSKAEYLVNSGLRSGGPGERPPIEDLMDATHSIVSAVAAALGFPVATFATMMADQCKELLAAANRGTRVITP